MWQAKEIETAKRKLEKAYKKDCVFLRQGPSLLFLSGSLALRLSKKQEGSAEKLAQEKRLIHWLNEKDFPTIELVEENEEERKGLEERM